ncbi:glycosyltransferase family 2 protein [Sphingomonas sp. TDK1]|uniref:glycosyltransferase family 2 protein n=1 Tax=Sphingomonas sp. TDK1 TaxID=453247 RepID=UPI0007DA48CF|nr:glycosyltransferase [Sphingomonas sp. TDK1]OAN66503.1 glycosyl transferase family 2 [Sphingomonas sp. TDK1]
MPGIYVIIATIGRAELTRLTVDRLADQTRPPDGVVVVSVKPEDVTGVDQARGNVSVVFSEKGSSHQRNRGIDLVIDKADILIFFDDDFLPCDNYLEEAERILTASPDIAGITGDLIADGIHTGGYTFEEAVAMVDSHTPPAEPQVRDRPALYGCNMAIRASAARDIRFDETLPQYAWLEDIDYARQVFVRGRLISSSAVSGVHLGVRGGRTSGIKLGYSQVANVVYLKRKGTIQPWLGERLLLQQLTSNLLRSLRPEPNIDRRGRLKGNLMAIGDILFRGRIDPGRINRL